MGMPSSTFRPFDTVVDTPVGLNDPATPGFDDNPPGRNPPAPVKLTGLAAAACAASILAMVTWLLVEVTGRPLCAASRALVSSGLREFMLGSGDIIVLSSALVGLVLDASDGSTVAEHRRLANDADGSSTASKLATRFRGFSGGASCGVAWWNSAGEKKSVDGLDMGPRPSGIGTPAAWQFRKASRSSCCCCCCCRRSLCAWSGCWCSVFCRSSMLRASFVDDDIKTHCRSVHSRTDYSLQNEFEGNCNTNCTPNVSRWGVYHRPSCCSTVTLTKGEMPKQRPRCYNKNGCWVTTVVTCAPNVLSDRHNNHV